MKILILNFDLRNHLTERQHSYRCHLLRKRIQMLGNIEMSYLKLRSSTNCSSATLDITAPEEGAVRNNATTADSHEEAVNSL